MGASPTPLLVTSIERISIVFSSIPMWILRQMRRFGPPTARQGIAEQCTIGMLARIPLTFALGLDTGAVHKKVQWSP